MHSNDIGAALCIGERDPERATFPGVERMYVASHAGRHLPRRDRARIEKRAIDARAGRVHADTDSGRAHARTLAPAVRRTTCRPRGNIAARFEPRLARYEQRFDLQLGRRSCSNRCDGAAHASLPKRGAGAGTADHQSACYSGRAS